MDEKFETVAEWFKAVKEAQTGGYVDPRLKRMDQWVSVKDRLPEVNKYVYLFSVERKYGLGRLKNIGGEYQWNVVTQYGFYYFHGDEFDDITHWMPLPDPPESEE